MCNTEIMIELIKLLAIVFAGLWALYEFREAQKWKRAEYAAGLLRRLQSDNMLRAACVFLDWDARNCPLPEPYRFGECDKATTFVHNKCIMKTALRCPDVNGGQLIFTPIEVYYRDVFDALFEYMTELKHALKTKLVSPDQIKPVSYWIEKVSQGDESSIIDEYVREYHPGLSIELLVKMVASRKDSAD